MNMGKFSINPSDVAQGGSRMSGGRKKARYSRASQLTSREMILIHRPTGVHVKGDIREGNYTRDEMRNFERELYQRLYILLENEVAKFLRVSGR